MLLVVYNLPKNRLALTNKVYVSPATLQELGIRPDMKSPLVKVENLFYMIEEHSQVEDGQIALNRLQQRRAHLSLATPVSVKSFRPPPTFALASLEFAVDNLVEGNMQPCEIDTDRLASEVLLNYEDQPFEVGRVVPMIFEGTYIELTVKAVATMPLDKSTPTIYANMGRLVQTTKVLFSSHVEGGASVLQLTGEFVSGGQTTTKKPVPEFIESLVQRARETETELSFTIKMIP